MNAHDINNYNKKWNIENKKWSPKPERTSANNSARSHSKCATHTSKYHLTPINPTSTNSPSVKATSVSSFVDALAATIDDAYNRTLTENGAVAFEHTSSKLLDLNFALSSLNGSSDKEILDMWVPAFNEDPLLAMKWLFYSRDVLQGAGMRHLFRVCLNDLAKDEPKFVEKFIPLVADYGRWDDLYCLVGTKCEKPMFAYMKKVFDKDLKEARENLA